MKKLKLSLEDLRVQSFATTAAGAGPEGTVFAQTTNPDPESGCNTCTTQQDTLFVTCNGCGGLTVGCNNTDTTCYDTCNCANDSVPGWASCGTTCQAQTCQQGCVYPTNAQYAC